MPLDVAAQGEEQGLEPCPDPKRSFLTYRLPLDRKCEKRTVLLFVATHQWKQSYSSRPSAAASFVAFVSDFRKGKKQIRYTINVVHATMHVDVCLSR